MSDHDDGGGGETAPAAAAVGTSRIRYIVGSPPVSPLPSTIPSRQGSLTPSDDAVERGSTASDSYASNYSSLMPFAINCRLSKTFFGMPRKCSRCDKMIMLAAGYACQFCTFRCHRKCAAYDDQYPSSSSSSVISSADAPSSSSQASSPTSPLPSLPRRRRCSLSRLPAGGSSADDSSLSLPGGHGAKANGSLAHHSLSPRGDNNRLWPEIYPEQWWTSGQQHPASGACSPALSQQVAGSLPIIKTGSTGTAVSSSGFGSGGAAETDEICLYSSSCESVQTLTSADEHANSPPYDAGDAKVRRPFFTEEELSKVTGRPPADSNLEAEGDDSAAAGGEEPSVMSRLLKLWPWNVAAPTDPAGGPNSSGAKLSAHYVSSPVDSFNRQVLENLMSRPHKQSIGGGSSSAATSASLADSAISSSTGAADANFANRLNVHTRRLNWVRFMAGERNAHSQDCPIEHHYLESSSPSIVTQIRNKSLETEDMGYMTPSGACSPATLLGAHRGAAANPVGSAEAYMPLRLAASWPLLGLHINYEDQPLGVDASTTDLPTSSSSSDGGGGGSSSRGSPTREHGTPTTTYQKRLAQRGQSESFRDLGEWSIPFADLHFGDCLYKGRSVETYRGRWHGEVLIHTYDSMHLERFLRDVHTLTKIRHENIALFMGACMEPPNLAVVTSIRKRERLFDAIYVRKRPLDMSQRLLIAKQIAQGIGYLHAKGIVLRCLTSKSIFLDGKVKICTVDYGGPAIASCNSTRRVHGGSILCRHQLACMSPEVIRSLRLDGSNVRIDSRMHSKHSDVYAFGSVLFELFSGEHAYSDKPADTIIYSIGNGIGASTDRLACSPNMRSLIDDCWALEPSYRPIIADVLTLLLAETSVRMTKRQSSSEPEQMNRVGLMPAVRSPRQTHHTQQHMIPFFGNIFSGPQ